jgi:hypothetical protein
VPENKLKAIVAAAKMTGQYTATKPIRDILGDDYTYGEIRFVLEHLKRQMQ